MRFGIEAGAWNNPRGYGRFLRGVYGELLTRSRHEWVLTMDSMTEQAAGFPAEVPRLSIALPRAAAGGASAHASRSWMEMLRMSRGLSRARFDAILFPSPLTYVPVRSTPEVLVVHDVLAERFPGLVFESAAAARRWRWKTKTGLRRARRVMTVSERSRSGIAEIYGLDPRDITVAPEAADPIFFEPADAVERGRPYVIYAGGLSPHKNLETLLASLRAVPEIDLVLAGPFLSDRFHVEDLSASIDALGLGGRVERVSEPGDARLRDLYAGALALVLPSLEEGFGLPAVEAAAAGTPVVLSRGVAAADFLEGALLFDPRDAETLAGHLRKLSRDPQLRERLGRAARQSAGRLSWKQTAEIVEGAMEAAASE